MKSTVSLPCPTFDEYAQGVNGRHLLLNADRARLSLVEQACAVLHQTSHMARQVPAPQEPLAQMRAALVHHAVSILNSDLQGYAPALLLDREGSLRPAVADLTEKLKGCRSNYLQFMASIPGAVNLWLRGQIVASGISLWQSAFSQPMTCMQFVAFHLNQPNLRKHLVPRPQPRPIELLLADCKRVEKPRVGDLVVYYYGEKWGKEARHVGFWAGDNHVVSKWGNPLPAYRHPMDRVFIKYGSYVVFMRRKHQSPLTPILLAVLAQIEHKQFSHPCYHSPYSPLGVHGQLRQKTYEALEKYPHQPNTLFGQAFHEKLQSRFSESFLPVAEIRVGVLEAYATAVKQADRVPVDIATCFNS